MAKETVTASQGERSSGPLQLPCGLTFGPYRMVIRQLEPRDLGTLVEFLSSYTPEVLHGAGRDAFTLMTPDFASCLLNMEQTRDVTLGVFELGVKQPELLAVGGGCLDETSRRAEVRFVVREHFRRLGIATALLQAIASIARQRGVELLVATTHESNAAMLAVFRRFNARVSASEPDGSVTVTLPVCSVTELQAPQFHTIATRHWRLGEVVTRARARLEHRFGRRPAG